MEMSMRGDSKFLPVDKLTRPKLRDKWISNTEAIVEESADEAVDSDGDTHDLKMKALENEEALKVAQWYSQQAAQNDISIGEDTGDWDEQVDVDKVRERCF